MIGQTYQFVHRLTLKYHKVADSFHAVAFSKFFLNLIFFTIFST